MNTQTQETLEGQGQLESWEHPENRIAVEYRFDITTEILERPGFPRVATRRHSSGTVRAITGESLSEGYFRLVGSDGEILKVKNMGLAMWAILAS